MAPVRNSKGAFSVTAYAGDAKTLLAFNLDEIGARDLAGFTIQCAPEGQDPYYLWNQLQFERPDDHVQDGAEPPNSSVNAPIHKFRWFHVPGSVHQGLKPFMGRYTYTVTPRYFDANKALLPLDHGRSVSVDIDVVPFTTGNLRLGFARGYTQSQAFVHHFGKDALIRPKTKELLFDTSQPACTNGKGDTYTFADEYDWLGFTARERIFELLKEVRDDATGRLHLDMFAYDLNEPDFAKIALELAGQGRVRLILDNAVLHHNVTNPEPEDEFEAAFRAAKPDADAIKRGKFGRYAHDKVLVVYDAEGPLKALTGSTNFSVTGIYVNSNHVLVFDDRQVAAAYAAVFEESWQCDVKKPAFQVCVWATAGFTSTAAATPSTTITFSPHTQQGADAVCAGIVERVDAEAAKVSGGSVLFAVMEMGAGTKNTVYDALNAIHKNMAVFSFGISDNPEGVCLYKPGTREGLLVSGKPVGTILPPPFDQVPGVVGHQIHHKFVVCGFNQDDATVFCGSSNLANGGEEANGDNLLAIHDTDVATAYAIEALCLVDHFSFLDKYATGGKGSTAPKPGDTKPPTPAASPKEAAVAAGWFLSTSDGWTKPYFDAADLKCADRELFA